MCKIDKEKEKLGEITKKVNKLEETMKKWQLENTASMEAEDICLLTSINKKKAAWKYTWLADSAASSHMTHSDKGMFNVRMEESDIIIGNRQSLKAYKVGDLHMTF